MGRIDTDASTQYHQGLQFQEFHQTPAPETIDDAPPDEEDYELPPESAGVTNDKPPPPPPPQAFPPPQDHTTAAVHSFPPKQHDKPPQPFPPTQEQITAQSFPPPQDHHAAAAVFFPPPHQQYHHNPPQPQPFPPQEQVTPQPFLHHQQQQVPNVPIMQIPAQQPSPVLIPQLTPQEWKTHLFGCMSNPKIAIITLLFPCITFGQIAEILDRGSTSCGTSGTLYTLIACCIAMPCIMSCTYRTKLRSKFGLVESPAPDCLVHCFCEYCALCQEYNELQERGIDPSLGWLGNVAKLQKQQQFGLLTPPMQQRMI